MSKMYIYKYTIRRFMLDQFEFFFIDSLKIIFLNIKIKKKKRWRGGRGRKENFYFPAYGIEVGAKNVYVYFSK